MDDFLAYKKEVRSATSGDTYTSVSEQITRQQADLKAAQDKLTNYQRDNNVAVLEEQAKAASAYLTQLLAEFSQLKVEYQLLEAMTPEGQWALAAVTNALLGAADPGKLAASSLPSAAPPPELLRAQQELEKIRIIRARLSKYLRPGHPKIIKLDEEISRGEKLVEFFSQQSRDQLVNAKQTVKLKLDRVQETIKEWEAKVNNASVRIAEYQRMKLDVERLQGLNDRLLGLLQTVDVTRNLDQENITVLDRASKAKDAKHTILVAAFLLFVGLGAGLGLVFLVEQADDRLMSLEELGGRFQEWVVGQIPEVRRAKKKKRPALLDADDCRHTFAESHRNIRSALFFANYNEPKPKTLLVTSAIPNEGKSTVAANLARTIAFAGGRVLLVDGDMRRGVLHQLFETPQEPGLSDLLINGGDLSQFVIPIPLGPEVSGQSSVVSHQSSAATAPSSVLSPQSSVVSGQPQVSAFSPQPSPKPSTLNSQRPPTSDPVPPTSDLRPLTTGHLFLLPRGQTAQNSGELFLSEKCDRLLAQMREQYDCVILDSIPVFAADDTTSLAPKVDGVLFVMRNKFTSADTARHALELLYERQAKIMGLVFNRANSASRSYKYYKYAKYYHEETKDL
jgi:Mrp family chromosome partitioning ATPase